MPNFSSYIDELQAASRGSQVRNTIINALKALNDDSRGNALSLSGHTVDEFVLKNDFFTNVYFDDTPVVNSNKAVTSDGLFKKLHSINGSLDRLNESITTEPLQVTKNGTYVARDGHAFSVVEVNVS